MSYTSIEALIYNWVEERGITNCSRGDICDLAEKFTSILMPYRELYRAMDKEGSETITKLIRDAARMERSI